MTKIPHLEVNCIPSQLNTSKQTGVASQLAAAIEDPSLFSGVTIEQMRGNPLFERGDVIDKRGKAQKGLVEATKTIKTNAKRIRALEAAAQHYQQKPKNN